MSSEGTLLDTDAMGDAPRLLGAGQPTGRVARLGAAVKRFRAAMGVVAAVLIIALAGLLVLPAQLAARTAAPVGDREATILPPTAPARISATRTGAVQSPPAQHGWIANTGRKGTWLYTAPDTAAPTRAKIAEGAMVEVTGRDDAVGDGRWVLVRFHQWAGYVQSPLVELAPPSMPTPTVNRPAPARWAAVAGTDGEGLHIRSTPSRSAPVVLVVPATAILRVIAGPQTDDSGSAWYQITQGETAGWVSGSYLRLFARACLMNPESARLGAIAG